MNEHELGLINQRLDRLEDRLDNISVEMANPKEIEITHKKEEKYTALSLFVGLLITWALYEWKIWPFS